MANKVNRAKTGDWRPFRPAGMSDGTWRTVLLLHRYPTDEMDEEEQRYCLGPMLFGKGGPRFGDYGRGWIQERADELVKEGLTPYFMDAREWRDEIADAVDYYNGMGFDQAEEEGIIKAEADFFAANIPWTGGSKSDNAAIERYFEARERASSKIDEVWYGICYGPFGTGPWNLLTKGVQNGWQNVFTCDESAAFQNIGDFDWRCASLGQDVDDVLEMSEMCPISGNPTIIGGIDLALDFAGNGGLSTNQKSRVVRFLKRAFGELYKRGKAVMKIEGEDADIASYFDQLSERELAAQRFFGRAVMPDFEDFCERSDLMIKVGRRRIERINERFDLWIKERRGQSPH